MFSIPNIIFQYKNSITPINKYTPSKSSTSNINNKIPTSKYYINSIIVINDILKNKQELVCRGIRIVPEYRHSRYLRNHKS